MAHKIVETDEPVVQERQTVVHEDHSRGPLSTILIILFILVLLFILFAWRPWGSSAGGNTTNVNVPTPSTNSNQ